MWSRWRGINLYLHCVYTPVKRFVSLWATPWYGQPSHLPAKASLTDHEQAELIGERAVKFIIHRFETKVDMVSLLTSTRFVVEAAFRSYHPGR